MRLTVAIFVVLVAMLTGNALLVIAAVIGAAALALSGASQRAWLRTWAHTPVADHASVRVLAPDDDPEFLRWLGERNHRQQQGDDSGAG